MERTSRSTLRSCLLGAFVAAGFATVGMLAAQSASAAENDVPRSPLTEISAVAVALHSATDAASHAVSDSPIAGGATDAAAITAPAAPIIEPVTSAAAPVISTGVTPVLDVVDIVAPGSVERVVNAVDELAPDVGAVVSEPGASGAADSPISAEQALPPGSAQGSTATSTSAAHPAGVIPASGAAQAVHSVPSLPESGISASLVLTESAAKATRATEPVGDIAPSGSPFSPVSLPGSSGSSASSASSAQTAAAELAADLFPRPATGVTTPTSGSNPSFPTPDFDPGSTPD